MLLSVDPPAMRQLILDLMPETPPSFENFVVGGNSETLTGLVAWLAPESSEPMFFLSGEAGAGKTHLLRSSAGTYIDAALDPNLSSLGKARGLHAIDQVDALNENGQIALFNLFNRLRANAGRLLVAARPPPQQLTLREDLRTRLGCGLIYRLQALTEPEQITALAAQASSRGLRLPAGALDYLLARAPRDMRSLADLLIALDRYSLEHKRSITLPLLREVLRNPL
jgi:DnaA family protein